MKNAIIKGTALAAALLLFSSCSGDEKLLESTKNEKTVVKTVDEYEVPMELYRYLALNYKEQYEKGQSSDIWLGTEGQALLEELGTHVDESLVMLYATLSLCEDYGIDPDSAYVTDTVEATMQATYESFDYDYKAYTEYLAEENMNDSVYRFMVRNDVLAEELLYQMTQKGEIPSDEATLTAIIESDAFVRVKQILVPFDNGKTKEENLAYAERLLSQIENGADFDTLAQTSSSYGGDLFMFNNPDGYYICRGQYKEAFEDAAFSLQIGEISGIVESDSGYSIIKRYEKESAYLKAHYDSLAEDYMVGLYNIALEEHQKTLTVTDTDALKNFSLFTLIQNDQ